MSVLMRSSEISKRPVVTFAGEDVAQIKDIVYAANGGEIGAFTLAGRGLFAGPLKVGLPWAAVAGLGRRGIGNIASLNRRKGRMSRKDIIDTIDQPTTHNSPIYPNSRTGRDAACIAVIRQSGGVILGQTLGMLEKLGWEKLPRFSADRDHLLAEVFRRSFADRFLLGDPATSKATEAITSQINEVQGVTRNVVTALSHIQSAITEVNGISSTIAAPELPNVRMRLRG